VGRGEDDLGVALEEHLPVQHVGPPMAEGLGIVRVDDNRPKSQAHARETTVAPRWTSPPARLIPNAPGATSTKASGATTAWVRCSPRDCAKPPTTHSTCGPIASRTAAPLA